MESNPSELSRLLTAAVDIAHTAGQRILDIYQNRQYDAFTKSDNTPVTSADLAAHHLIHERLTQLAPEIPVLSEEAADIPLKERVGWSRYWLVDPLDGTQEFIARSGDFATIIALVENNRPVMGVVYAPVSGVTYYACSGLGAWKSRPQQDKVRLLCRRHRQDEQPLRVTISRRQNISRLTQQLSPAWQYEMLPLGSAALKACLVAEGKADCYLRLGPTGEWDTAATQCIVEEAGGEIMTTSLIPLSYNQRETLINPDFIVIGDTSLPWQMILTPETK
ncbi:3'(2'),5'-bisphosphate nucleotidase [Vibrio sp. HA2012]|uniref:3'(2'),5'-bisphosphate nucleotidase CysQ n=1 Tax=Vibrio sp. HA2012 TaxID=1971595 RepID=UPI000C2C0D2B|nr:3'(2'),5'-bisphosphate nucleotidase CysQ [Vibrio sp. HA2012]PJC85088.1 3'(2'),5'-bisphosphate nucleotidase [Vibrio sp. HA2012]